MGQKTNQKREQRKHNSRLFGLVALGVFALAVVLAIFGMGNSVSEIRNAEVMKSPDAILASSGVKEEYSVALPVNYYDQLSDQCVDLYDPNVRSQLRARQYEWSSCGYYSKKLEQGLVESELDEDGLPVAVKGKLTPNRGLNFNSWFTATDGISAESTGTLQLRYTSDGAKFSFLADEFYPLDDVSFSSNDPVNSDGHNHLFTMSFAVPFTVLSTGEEIFTISADDDTFIFLNGQLVIDMGGVHRAIDGGMTIDSDGNVYSSVNHADWEKTGQVLEPGETATLQIFHADRDSAESTFSLGFAGMDLALASGTQIAANLENPDDPTYVAPLGESKIFQPDSAQSLVIIATIESLIVVASAVMLVIVAKFIIRQRAA